jgi:lipopolysaccharide export system permease protein
MVLLRLPNILQKILPFAVLLGSITALTKLTRSSELIVARAAGISALQFLTPVMLCAFMIGALMTTVFNPLSAMMLSKFERIEAKYFHGTTSMLSISSSGLWLRQPDHELGGKKIIRALRVANEDMTLFDVTIFQFAEENRFYSRIDAASARLEAGYWLLKQAVLTTPGEPAELFETYSLPTDLSRSQIQESFAPPETFSFWELPAFIQTLEEAGFSGLRHRLYWHGLMSTPFMFVAMVLVAAIFSLRPPRQGKTGLLITLGIFSGFIVYFTSDVVAALGLSGRLPVVFAAWAPVGVTALLGLAVTLHLEDG